MLRLGRGGRGPRAGTPGGKIDLLPRRQPHLARPCRGEDQEFERQLGPEPRAGGVDCSDRSRYLAMRQGRHMADVFRTFGESCRDGLAGRIVLAVSLRDGPFMTVPIRRRTLRAVSCLHVQIGARMSASTRN